MEYIGTSVNESATVVCPADAAITGARGIALALDEGGVVKLPEAGANVLGITVFETEENVAAGDDVDVQIKCIGKWMTAAAVKAGDELATDATGKAVPAESGDFVVGMALKDAESGSYVSVQISKSGYKA